MNLGVKLIDYGPVSKIDRSCEPPGDLVRKIQGH